MPTPANPPAPKPAGDDRNLVRVDENYVAPGFEDRVRLFWEKNSKLVTVVLVAVLLAIAAKGGWEFVSAQREKSVEQAYAAAKSTAELKGFAAANAAHALAGVALLRVADEAYAAGKFGEAATGYAEALKTLPAGPLASRARLGAAVAKLEGGNALDGETALKAIAADENELKVFRAEAIHHLASVAAAQHRSADLKTYADQLMKLDPQSPWTQRVLRLLSLAPVESAPAGVPAVSVPAGAAPASPAIKLPEPKK